MTLVYKMTPLTRKENKIKWNVARMALFLSFPLLLAAFNLRIEKYTCLNVNSLSPHTTMRRPMKAVCDVTLRIKLIPTFFSISLLIRN